MLPGSPDKNGDSDDGAAGLPLHVELSAHPRARMILCGWSCAGTKVIISCATDGMAAVIFFSCATDGTAAVIFFLVRRTAVYIYFFFLYLCDLVRRTAVVFYFSAGAERARMSSRPHVKGMSDPFTD